METIKTWQERCLERGIGSCEARDEELTELRVETQTLMAEVELYKSACDRRDAELDAHKRQKPAYLLTPGGYVVGARLDAGHAPGTLIELYLAAGAQPKAITAGAELESTKTVDRAWSQFCGGIGRGPDAPYPGMIEAFEAHYGQAFTDKDWRNETGVWAAAWGYATRQADEVQTPKVDN